MFSRSAIFSNINTKTAFVWHLQHYLFHAFCNLHFPPVVIFKIYLLLPACLLNSLSLLLPDINKKFYFFGSFHTSSSSSFASYFCLCFVFPCSVMFLLYFSFPPSPLHQFSSAPTFFALCKLLFIFSSPSIFFSFLCLHHHSLFPDSLAP